MKPVFKAVLGLAVALLICGSAREARADSMTVSASINPAFSTNVTKNMTIFNGQTSGTPNALAVASGSTYSDYGTFTLTTNCTVDVLMSASAADLVNGDSTLNVQLSWIRTVHGSSTTVASSSANFGETLTATSSTDASVTAGVWDYTINGTILTPVTATTLAGSYSGTISITVSQSAG